MRSRRSIASGLFALSLISFSALALWQRQNIFDWYQLRNYQPSADIAALATNTTMNDRARRLFYVYHPELNDRAQFSSHCPNNGEKTIVLGCYINTQGIFLFDVTDERLTGVEEVTAAHETLHAAYDRLSTKDKSRVDKLLNDVLNKLQDVRIHSTVESYRMAGADVNNELHSILGTEVRELSPELEAYYAQYFTDRSKIVEYSIRYEKVFSDRRKLADSYLKQMADIESQLTAIRQSTDALEAQLNEQYRQLQQERDDFDPRSQAEVNAYNAKVNAYNGQVAIYKNKIGTYNQLVQQHNQILEKYNTIALEENELIKAIDSRAPTVSNQ